MAPSIYLTTYSFRAQCLDDTHDCWQLLQDYFQQRNRESYQDMREQQVLKVDHFTQRGRFVSGFLRKGDYGITSELVDIEQNTVTYRRRPVEAEMLPFYFLAAVPERDCHGLLILQRTGLLGVKRLLERDMRSWWEDRGCSLKITPLIPSELINQLLEHGRVVKIRLIRYSIPTDIADAVYQGGYTPEDGYMELQIRAKKGKRFWIANKVRDFLRGDRRISEFMEVEGFDYENVKIEVELGGGRRTIDFAHLERVRPRYDITQDINIVGGMPTFESIDRVARAMAVDLLKGLGIDEQEVSRIMGP